MSKLHKLLEIVEKLKELHEYDCVVYNDMLASDINEIEQELLSYIETDVTYIET